MENGFHDFFFFFFIASLSLLSCLQSNAAMEEHVMISSAVGDISELGSNSSSCDFFRGSWVVDESFPLYSTTSCPFIEKQFDCGRNGRPDQLYLKFRWKPSNCPLPRFDGKDFLTRFKGKKILFVGDSLSLNQWESLTCMLHSSVPQSKFTLAKSVFTIPDYDFSVSLNRNEFLVDIVKEDIGVVLKLDSIENGEAWKGYDMLIFNTWHWWVHTGKHQPWEYIRLGDKILKDMDRLEAFKEGLTTWSKWVDNNTDPAITKVFFQGISPVHDNGKEWNKTRSTCEGQTEPIKGSVYPGRALPQAEVVKEVLSKMSKPVTLLDITTLSQLRKDGHPSVYGIDGKKGNDCSHWCLAGVPDTWNEILFSILVTQGGGSS